MDRDRHFLMYMSQAIGHIEQFVRGKRSAFMESMLVRHGCLWNLELISIAARRLSQETKEEHSGVDWERLCGLGHDVIGNPWEVDNDRVWDLIHEELSELRDHIRRILVSAQLK